MCFLWFHKWGKWVEKERGMLHTWPSMAEQMTGVALEWRPAGEWIRQERECERCGKKQVHVAKP